MFNYKIPDGFWQVDKRVANFPFVEHPAKLFAGPVEKRLFLV